jgi:hypothetical protein
MRNLIESWLSVVLIPGMTVAQAVRDLNDELGALYTPQDFYKWRRGDRPIPQPVQDYMLRSAVGHAVHKTLGINTLSYTDKQLDQLAESLTPPKRKP